LSFIYIFLNTKPHYKLELGRNRYLESVSVFGIFSYFSISCLFGIRYRYRYFRH